MAGRRAERRPILVGFAAETEDLAEAGPAKLAAKGCDLLVANRVDLPGSGFGGETNQATIFDADGGREEIAQTSKDELALRICARVAALLDTP